MYLGSPFNYRAAPAAASAASISAAGNGVVALTLLSESMKRAKHVGDRGHALEARFERWRQRQLGAAQPPAESPVHVGAVVEPVGLVEIALGRREVEVGAERQAVVADVDLRAGR